jgi:sodium/bile acid cotransporter 7
MGLKFRLPIDPFIVGLITAVILATLLPCHGESAVLFGVITNAAIALLFFLHGAKLSREAILNGIGNWRLHLTVPSSCSR